MKIVVISDTHIHEKADSLPLELLKEIKGADMVIHAGDFVNLELLQQLKSLCNDVRAVKGNMDPQEIKDKLAEKEIFNVGKYKIGVMHGYGAPNKIREILSLAFKDDKVDIIVFGHSHAALNERIGDTLFFNPGSPTDKIFASFNSYGIIEINDTLEAKIVTI